MPLHPNSEGHTAGLDLSSKGVQSMWQALRCISFQDEPEGSNAVGHNQSDHTGGYINTLRGDTFSLGCILRSSSRIRTFSCGIKSSTSCPADAKKWTVLCQKQIILYFDQTFDGFGILSLQNRLRDSKIALLTTPSRVNPAAAEF